MADCKCNCKKDDKEIVMNGAGIAELGFPMWPQFAPETVEAVQEPIRNGKVNYWTGTKGMEFEEMFRQWSLSLIHI